MLELSWRTPHGGPESSEKPSVQENLHILVSEVGVSTVHKWFVLGGLLKALSLLCPLLLPPPGEPWPVVSEVLLPGEWD